MKEFVVNKYIKLKLEDRTTNIYINDIRFLQCKSLKLGVPLDSIDRFEGLDSVDEVIEIINSLSVDLDRNALYEITPEVEFWGHCSSFQVWKEHDYDTNFLPSSLAFPILVELADVGDYTAKRVLKDEIAKRITGEYVPVIIYLIMHRFLDYFNNEEIQTLIEIVKKGKIDINRDVLKLIYSFKEKRNLLNLDEIIFLIEHPKVKLFELLIKFGKNYFEKDGNFIGEFRLWVLKFLHKLTKERPKYFKVKVEELIKNGSIAGINNCKDYSSVDYSLLDEFSILLINRLRYI